MRYAVEVSSDLIQWTPLEGQEQVDPRNATTETVTVVDTRAIGLDARRFLRLRVE